MTSPVAAAADEDDEDEDEEDEDEDEEDEEDDEDDEDEESVSRASTTPSSASRGGLPSSLRRPSSSSGRTMSASCTQESYLLCQPSQCTKYSVPVNMRQQISVVTIINGELRKVRRR